MGTIDRRAIARLPTGIGFFEPTGEMPANYGIHDKNLTWLHDYSAMVTWRGNVSS